MKDAPKKPREKKKRNRPLKVMVLTPPLDNSGGVGTLYTYARECFPKSVEVTFVDTRGYFKSPWLSIFCLIRSGAKLTQAKITGNVDVIHLNLGSRGSSLRKFTLMILCQWVLKIPCVVQIHSGQFINFYSSRSRPTRSIMIKLLNGNEKILALGSVWRESLISIGCEPSKIIEFQMGVPDIKCSDEYVSNHYLPTQRDYVELVFAGKLGAHKGLPSLFIALGSPELQNVRLILLGPGNLSEWMQMAAVHGVLNKIAFLGSVEPSSVHGYINYADAMILPSESEGLPVVALETLSAERVVISTRVGSLSDFLSDGENVIFLEGNSPDEIRRKIVLFEKYLLNSRGLGIAQEGRRAWSEYFDSKKTTSTLSEIWHSAFL